MNPDNDISVDEFVEFNPNDAGLQEFLSINRNATSGLNTISASSDLLDNNERKTKTRGKAIDWTLRTKFSSVKAYEESAIFLDINNGQLKHHKTSNTKRFVVKMYWCEYSSKRQGYDCQYKVRMEFKNDNTVHFYDNAAEHSHSLILGAKRKYKSWTAGEDNKMKSLIAVDITSRNLKKSMVEDGSSVPSSHSFYSKTKRLKKMLGLSQTLVTKEELNEFFISESSIPEDLNQIFISDYYYENETDFQFGAIFTTGLFIRKYLKTNRQWCLNLDFTYNLSTDGFIILFFGSTDEMGCYHPFGWGMFNHENLRAVQFFLEWISKECSIKPHFIMADGAPQITLAIENVFPESIRLMCSYHGKKNIRNHLGEVRAEDPQIANEIMLDISILQSGSIDHDTFISVFYLLVEKWTTEKNFSNEGLTNKIKRFFSYVEKTWVNSKLSFWYQGSFPFNNTTNNAVEAWNQVFKQRYSLRQKLGLHNLMLKLSEISEEWWEKAQSYDLAKAYEQQLSPMLKKQAYDFLQKFDPELILSKPNSGNHRPSISSDGGLIYGKVVEIFVLPKRIELKITKNVLHETGKIVLKHRFRNSYQSFRMFAESFETCAIVEKVEGSDGKYSYCCNCFSNGEKSPSGVKGKLCFHVVALYMRSGIIEKPSLELATNVAHSSISRFPTNRRQTF